MENQNFVQMNEMNTFGSTLIGLRYECNIFEDVHQRFIHFPKDVLMNARKIREFEDPQKYLYYYLLWNCKLAVIDREFVHYAFKDAKVEDIGVYNCELHDKRTNAELFVVAKFTNKMQTFKGRQPLWSMDRMMTARQLLSVYGINECDLPKGSRSKRNSFSAQITLHYQKLHELVHVYEWTHSKVDIIPNKKNFNMNSINGADMIGAIKRSIHRIKDEEDELELIPILTIKNRVYCDVLIPIQVNDTKWFAVSYKTSTIRPYKATVTGLYVDAEDILCKASLVDANAVSAYDHILPQQEEKEMQRLKLFDNSSCDTNASTDTDQSMSSSSLSLIYSLQCELCESVQRERLLMEEIANSKSRSSSPPNNIANMVNVNVMPSPNIPMFVPVSPLPPPPTAFHLQTPTIQSLQPAHSAPPILNLTPFQQRSPVINGAIASFNSLNFHQKN